MSKKYSTAATKKIGKVMHEFKEGKLKSSSGDKVTKRKQAIAIGISEAKQKGLKVPVKKKAAAKKNIAVKKKAAPKKKSTVRKSTPVKKAVVAKKKTSSVAKPVIHATKTANPKKAAPKKIISDIPITEEIKYTTDTPVVEQTANNIPPVEEKSPLVVPVNTMAPGLDKKTIQRAALRSYDNHTMPLSSHRKDGIKPAGKKPLW